MTVTNGTNFPGNKQKFINLEEWSKLISEWESSTENQKEFCTRLNLNINTFTYAKGKFYYCRSKKPKLPVKRDWSDYNKKMKMRGDIII